MITIFVEAALLLEDHYNVFHAMRYGIYMFLKMQRRKRLASFKPWLF